MNHGDTPEAGTRTEEFACDGPLEIDVNMRDGLLNVRATDVPDVRVRLSIGHGDTVSGTDEHALRECEISFSDARRRLQIRAPRGFRGPGLGVTVEAPEGSQLTARLRRGSVATWGRFTNLRAATGSGDIEIEQVNGDVHAAAGSGDLRLGHVSGRLRARSGSGRIEIAGIEGDGAKVTTGSGDVRLGVVEADVRARTGRGRVAVSEAARGRIDLATGSGDVTVGVRPGVAAEIDIASGSGRARSELDVAEHPPVTGAAVRIRARTGSGDAVVARAGV